MKRWRTLPLGTQLSLCLMVANLLVCGGSIAFERTGKQAFREATETYKLAIALADYAESVASAKCGSDELPKAAQYSLPLQQERFVSHTDAGHAK